MTGRNGAMIPQFVAIHLLLIFYLFLTLFGKTDHVKLKRKKDEPGNSF